MYRISIKSTVVFACSLFSSFTCVSLEYPIVLDACATRDLISHRIEHDRRYREHPLVQAIITHDTQKLAELLPHHNVNVIVSSCYNDEISPLMIAASYGNPKIFALLLNAHADVTATYGFEQPHAGYSVLRFALDSTSAQAATIIKMLIQAGANCNDFTESHFNPYGLSKPRGLRNMSFLSYAIATKRPLDLIAALIDNGADVNKDEGEWLAMNKNYWRPLLIAAVVQYTDAIELLVKAGADQHAYNSHDDHKTMADYLQNK